MGSELEVVFCWNLNPVQILIGAQMNGESRESVRGQIWPRIMVILG